MTMMTVLDDPRINISRIYDFTFCIAYLSPLVGPVPCKTFSRLANLTRQLRPPIIAPRGHHLEYTMPQYHSVAAATQSQIHRVSFVPVSFSANLLDGVEGTGKKVLVSNRMYSRAVLCFSENDIKFDGVGQSRSG